MRIFIILISAVYLAAGCKPKQAVVTTSPPRVNAAAPVTIYKTRGDYSKLIPITLSDDKKTIVNYPAPGDIYYNGNLAYPTALKNGYWLDNRGVGPNTAFIKFTYDEYSKLKANPGLDRLYGSIVDKDPFTEMYNAGNRAEYKNTVDELNTLITKGDLGRFKRLK